MSDFLIPLGGGNEIGGSAYYLSLEGMKKILPIILLRPIEIFFIITFSI